MRRGVYCLRGRIPTALAVRFEREEIADFIRRSGLPADDHVQDSIAENEAVYYSTLLKQRHWDDMADWIDELVATGNYAKVLPCTKIVTGN